MEINKCNECNEEEKLIKFKGKTDYFICERCWDEKINKGIANDVSFRLRNKHFKPSPKTGRI
jgi:recombinational DNA repair protein (RecF pathway)